MSHGWTFYMVKYEFLENKKKLKFSKNREILVTWGEIWTCYLMITSLLSYPLNHRGKLTNSADYVSLIQQTPKYALLAHKMYNVQTHIGFTTLGSKVNTFWVLGNWKVKKVSGTPCIIVGNTQLETHYIPKPLSLIFLHKKDWVR